MPNKLTWAEAMAAARKVVCRIEGAGHQWDLGAINSCLPAGWYLHPAATPDAFYPVTVSDVADTIQHYAVYIPADQ